MSQQLLSIVALGLCALIVVSAPADVINWISSQDGFWDYAPNWDPEQRPGENDDAKHKTRLSAIKLRYDETCQSFEGNGTGAGDRFLLIQSAKRWTVGQNLYETDGGSETLNFAVKFEDGLDLLNRTELFVSGNVTGIDLVPDAGDGHVGDYVRLDIGGSVSNSVITLRDYCAINVAANVSDSSITLGNPQGTAGSATSATIEGNISGLPLLKLQGYTLVTVKGDITSTAPTDTVVVEDSAELTLPNSGQTVTGGNWTIKDAAEFSAVRSSTEVVRGTWSVVDDARLVATDFEPDELTVDGAYVSCSWLGDPVALRPWGLTIRGGATVFAASATFPDVNNVVSTVKYGGLNNRLAGGGAAQLSMYGSLEKESQPAALELDFGGTLQFATKTVRVTGGGETVITKFDAEGVDLIAREIQVDYTNLEVFGPDYSLEPNGHPLFVDSPCVRRWNRVTVANYPANYDPVILMDTASSTPISGGTSDDPPTELMPEALYAKDLVVEADATLRTSESPDVDDLNIYYTGTVTNNGAILDKNGDPYSPIQLTPTLYGDFDGDGEGNEPADVARFNAAFPSSKGNPAYDALVDWDCDGDIDCVDRTQYVDNWDPEGIEACPER